jgi:hypothetical protein
MADKSLEDRVAVLEIAVSSAAGIDLAQFEEPAKDETNEGSESRPAASTDT